MGHAELDRDDQDEYHDEDERRNAQQGEATGAQNSVHQAVGFAGTAHGRRDGHGEGQDLTNDDRLDVDRAAPP